MKNSAAVFLILFGCTVSSAIQAAALDLKSALRLALEHSPTLNAAQQSVFVSELQEKSARAAFLPVFEAQSQWGLTRSQPSLYASNFPLGSQAGLTLTENLYNNGINLTSLRIAQKNRELAQLTLQKTRDSILRDVGLAFFNYSLLSKRVEIQQNEVSLVKKQYNMVTQAYQQGLKTGKDFLRFKTQVVRSELDFETAKTALSTAKAELLRLLAQGHDDAADYDFSVTIDARDVQNVPQADPSLDNHYETLLADGQKYLQDMQISLRRRRTLPEVYLTSGASYGSSQFLGTGATWDDNQAWNYNALVTFKYTFWDFGTRQRDLQIAITNRQVVEKNLESTLIAVKSDIAKLMLDMNLRAKNYKLSDQLLKLEQKNFATIESEYRLGRVQYLDLITGLRDLSSAKVAYFSALFSLKQDLVLYRYNARDLYDWIFHE